MYKKETIAVACGLILQNGYVLVAHRAKEKQHGGLWEFPGGKLKPGENGKDAIIRELKEELGVDVEVVKTLDTIYYEYPDFFIELVPLVCQIVAGTPKNVEHTAIKWCEHKELQNLRFTPADRLIVSKLNQELLLEGL